MTSKPPTALVAVTDAIRWQTGCSRSVALSLAAVERLRAENAAAREEWLRLCGTVVREQARAEEGER